MRLNGKRIVEVMEEKSLTEETVCSRTGLYQKSFQWIVKEGFASEDAAEWIADAAGLTVGEIQLEMAQG
mgnify:CR=1 FL=1